MKLMKTIVIAVLFMLFPVLCLFAQWEPDVRLTYDDAGSFTSNNQAWCIGVSGDSVHVVWEEKRDGNPEIYYKRSINGGTFWEVDTRLTNDPFQSKHTSIAVSGSDVHVVWWDKRDENDGIYYKRSSDAGTTWETDIRLTDSLGFGDYPSAATSSGNNVHVVWQDYRDTPTEIYYKRSTDAGVTWGPDTRLSNDSGWSVNTSIAASSGNNIVVVWGSIQIRSPIPKIFYIRSANGGLTWEQDTLLTESEHALRPCISITNSNVHVVWMDGRHLGREIYYKRSTDGGATWEPDARLTNIISYSEHPSIASSDSFVHIVWREDRDWKYEIYYKVSSDRGLTWGEDTRLTYDYHTSENASVAVSDSCVHVVWKDYRHGNNPEIYYKRNPTGNIGIKGEKNNISKTIDKKLTCYPNPFTTSTIIHLSGIGHSAKGIELKVYDISGRLVKRFVRGKVPNSQFSILNYTWDGRDAGGKEVKAGIYFLKADEKNVGKVVKVR